MSNMKLLLAAAVLAALAAVAYFGMGSDASAPAAEKAIESTTEAPKAEENKATAPATEPAKVEEKAPEAKTEAPKAEEKKEESK